MLSVHNTIGVIVAMLSRCIFVFYNLIFNVLVNVNISNRKPLAGKLHPVWRNTTSQLDILKATVKAQLLVKRYPLSTSRTAGKKWSNICPLCEVEPETTAHFLLQCSKLSNIRQQYLPNIKGDYDQPPDDIVKIILDASCIIENPTTHETLCRNYTYKLHHKRSTLFRGSVWIQIE